jgi:hypothetical protein
MDDATRHSVSSEYDVEMPPMISCNSYSVIPAYSATVSIGTPVVSIDSSICWPIVFDMPGAYAIGGPMVGRQLAARNRREANHASLFPRTTLRV